jgi:hypothetical protein
MFKARVVHAAQQPAMRKGGEAARHSAATEATVGRAGWAFLQVLHKLGNQDTIPRR